VPSDPEQFIHLTPDESHVADLRLFAALPETLATLPMSVSTGRVVDFRTRDNLVRSPEDGTVPLIYPTHMQDGRLSWPRDGKKPNALRLNADTVSLLLPAGWYVVVKRFSAKEEPRRIVASLVTDQDLPGQQWAFENHLNVYHCGNRTLDPLIAVGLCIWLNSSAVDNAFRQFSGHTQVNATDLRNLRYPSVDTLKALATAAGSSIPDQLTIDSLISGHVWKSMV
jgi:adenine-specific DNA-methyltransferase